jgi:hypothetical protein
MLEQLLGAVSAAVSALGGGCSNLENGNNSNANASATTNDKQKPCPTTGASQMSVHSGRMEAKGSIFRSELSRKKELEKSKKMYFAPKAANKSDSGSVYKQKSRYFGDGIAV